MRRSAKRPRVRPRSRGSEEAPTVRAYRGPVQDNVVAAGGGGVAIRPARERVVKRNGGAGARGGVELKKAAVGAVVGVGDLGEEQIRRRRGRGRRRRGRRRGRRRRGGGRGRRRKGSGAAVRSKDAPRPLLVVDERVAVVLPVIADGRVACALRVVDRVVNVPSQQCLRVKAQRALGRPEESF